MLLLVVLPLQGVVQLVAGVQGHRHMHTGAAPAAASPSPLRALLNQLHAAQDPRLQAAKLAWVVSTGPAAELHAHGGVFHKHSHDAADVLEVTDPADDSLQGGATAFLAWLPVALALPAGEAGGRPATLGIDWRDRVVAPPLTPPRG
ncbi:hypothetical protein [Roseateles sp.]|uniref:hypothetical protein n=1 Tax=Roseateles sp. TaxID=1971397 RepID=UPI003265C512